MIRKTTSKFFLIVFLLIPVLSNCVRKAGVQAETISVDSIRQHMEYLVSDETEGRLTASPGYKKAADYVMSHFESCGLEPGWKNDNGEKTYYQRVPFIRYQYGDKNILVIRSDGETKNLAQGEKNFEIFYPGIGSTIIPEGNPVFVGYGIHDLDLGWDDFEGLDVRHKLAIIMAGFPNDAKSGPEFPPEVRQKYSDRRAGDFRRFLNVIERGAAGMIAIPDRRIVDNWDFIMAERNRFNLAAVEDYGPSSPGETPIPAIILHADQVNRLFEDMDFNPITYEGNYRPEEMNDVKLGLSIDVQRDFVHCYNIIGIVPGTDPELGDEYITVGAHLDHLGKDGDVIYRGANDNASSSVIILELAKTLAEKPLKRPVVLILFTAEEMGHFGSLHYVAHPAVPHDQVLLNINLEQIGAKTRSFDGIWAIGPASEREQLLSVKANTEGMELSFDDIESQVSLISGSDTLSFYLKKLPAIILGSGGFPEHHQSSDNLDLIDYEHLHRAALFVQAYIEELGNN